MLQKDYSSQTNQELLEKAKKLKSQSITNGAMIGFMIGVLIYSLVNHGLTFYGLIPLLLIYVFVRNSKNDEGLKEELEKRNLG